MADPKIASSIFTHYYKIAHLKHVSYSIFNCREASSDQELLELELQIRFDHPRILLTYYNKCLYYFRFSHWHDDTEMSSETGESHFDLEKMYPVLSLKYESTVSVDQLANPSRALKNAASKRPSPSKEGVSADDLLAYASLSFLKAVKKTLVYNLSVSGHVHIFGNYVIGRVSDTSSQYGILQVDPVLLTNGDLIVSLTERKGLPLFHSSILNLDNVFSDLASSFVIYVIPSGLRCHLYDSTTISNSFTHNPPKASENVLRLLKLSTKVDLSNKQDILWVKLIPNLQHLNNQTSKVSRFIHSVENKKYILWPWELCVLQFGSSENAATPPNPTNNVDPISLIDDFLSFTIGRHEEKAHQKAQAAFGPNSVAPGSNGSIPTSNPYSVPTAMSPGFSTGMDIKSDLFNGERSGYPSVADDFNYPSTDPFGETMPKSEMTNNGLDSSGPFNGDVLVDGTSEPAAQDKADSGLSDDDDLFGDSSDVEMKQEAPSDDIIDKSSPNGNTEPQPQASPQSPSPVKSEDSQSKDESTYVSIPKEEMISQRIKSGTPGSYKDPGAPLPVIPTPMIPQTANPQQGFSQPFSNPYSSASSRGTFSHNKDVGDELSSYSFAPIVFNPKIKSNIDTKYGKGGKFYVDREDSAGPDSNKKHRPRETSVVHYDIQYSQDSGNDPENGVDNRFDNTLGDATFLDMPKGANDESQPPEDEILRKNESMLDEHTNGNDFHAENEDDDDDDDDEDEDMIEQEDESDEDEDDSNSGFKSSPLKLNTHNSDIFNPSSNLPGTIDQSKNAALPNAHHSFLAPSSAQGSPGPNQFKAIVKGDSPLGLAVTLGDGQSVPFSPNAGLGIATNEVLVPGSAELALAEKEPKEIPEADKSLAVTSANASSGITESSNCLPFILRSINVFSIPNMFLLKDPSSWNPSIVTGFNMDLDEDEDDLELRTDPLSVSAKNMDEFLQWLMPNLVFDLGLTNYANKIKLRLPETYSDDVVSDVTDGAVSSRVAEIFASSFPLCYRISLGEFMKEGSYESAKSTPKAQPDLDDQLAFLDDSQVGGLEVDEPSKSLNLLFWDSIDPQANGNAKNFNSYHEASAIGLETKSDENTLFNLTEVKAKVLKNKNDQINLNFIGTRFWKYFDFKPVSGPKQFQVLMISERDVSIDRSSLFEPNNFGILETLRNNYKDNHLGSIMKLSLQTSETRQDLESINNGLLLVDKDKGDHSYTEWYKKLNKRLKNLVELIKLDLINKTNRFEFDRPLLLLFVNFDPNMNSTLQISKICRNFSLCLKNHQLSLVDVFTHTVPWNFVAKQSGHRCLMKTMSDLKLSKLSMTLYNKCPNNDVHASNAMKSQKESANKLYTQLVKEPPTSLNFKFLNKLNKEGSSTAFNDDLFLHVAYERSVDKNWISAAWSDHLGLVTHVKSWYCSLKSGYDKQAHDLGAIIADIWEASNMLFKQLNHETLQRTGGSGKKKFLVLTRISSIIPDDELVFWKRLTAKYKDVSLIVLSTNRLPKFLFGDLGKSKKPSVSEEDSTNGDRKFAENDFGKNNAPNFAASPGTALNLAASPLNATFHSPQQYINASTIFLSPSDGSQGIVNDGESCIKDTSFDVLGVIPRASLPSFNSPTRLGMRIGYLIKEAAPQPTDQEKRYMVFEVTLLSCSAYWNLNAVMKILLNQYKKLIVLNDILGTCDRDSIGTSGTQSRESELKVLVPWHINAVVKTLDYLVHVHVDE